LTLSVAHCLHFIVDAISRTLFTFYCWRYQSHIVYILLETLPVAHCLHLIGDATSRTLSIFGSCRLSHSVSFLDPNWRPSLEDEHEDSISSMVHVTPDGNPMHTQVGSLNDRMQNMSEVKNAIVN